jgi:hypothetical protein
VAVLEELSELDAGPSKGPGRQRLKTRVLSQVVSPGASTYLYDCCLRPDDVEFKVCVCGCGGVGFDCVRLGFWFAGREMCVY